MRQSKKHYDMQHKHPKVLKKNKPKVKEEKDPLRSNPNEEVWQLEQRKLKERHRDQLR